MTCNVLQGKNVMAELIEHVKLALQPLKNNIYPLPQQL